MQILRIHDRMPSWLGPALTEFEKQFSYPLGAGESFHVSHGADYLNFFRAMGAAVLFAAVKEQQVMGTLVGVRRLMKAGAEGPVPATYVCDLKVCPGPVRGRVLLALGRALEDHWRKAGGGVGYGVVMNGTSQTPVAYTGRGLLPGFTAVAQLMIFRFATRETGQDACGVQVSSLESLCGAFSELTSGGWVPRGSEVVLRSDLAPIPLVLGEPARACGLVEDTRRGKRLVFTGGAEMKSAHLSHFAFASVAEGAQLLRAALRIAREAGFPALFASVPASQSADLARSLSDLGPTAAPATVFGHGEQLSMGAEWWIHSSEI